jgi:hypothetical protein
MATDSRTFGRGWAYFGAVLGGAVSIAANIAHSYVPPTGIAGWAPQPGAVVSAVFWPVALFVAVEILARVSWPDGLAWTLLRFGGLLPVALVAAVVSYKHLAGLLDYYGEDALTVAIGPLAVDGLMVMATGALLATRPHTTNELAAPVVDRDDTPTDTPATASTVITAPALTPVAISRPEAPAHLIPTARFAIGQHEQRTGRPITADELAGFLSITPDTARTLLHAITGQTPAVNGAPVGGAR